MNKTTIFQVAGLVSAIGGLFTAIFMEDKRRTKKAELAILKEQNRAEEIKAEAERAANELDAEKAKWDSLSEASKLEYFTHKASCDRDVELKKKDAEIAHSAYLLERLKTENGILEMSNELKDRFAADVRKEAMLKLDKDYDSFKFDVYRRIDKNDDDMRHKVNKIEDKLDSIVDDIRKIERKSSSSSSDSWYASYQSVDTANELRKLRKAVERREN